jgi:hypothetical protein
MLRPRALDDPSAMVRSDDVAAKRLSPGALVFGWRRGLWERGWLWNRQGIQGKHMSHNTLFAPLITLVLWTFVMWAWLYATRIPVIRKNNIPLDPAQSKEAFNAQIPPQARWKADNYNHLLEQPTLFYAVTLSLVVLGASGVINTALAWSYVALRIAHSLVQATTNVIMIRFSIFIISSIVLLALTLRAAVLVF